jgi:hypothetical protein
MYEYKIKRNDRTRVRIIRAEFVEYAVRLAAGKEFYSARLDNWREDGSSQNWRVTLCAGKKDKTGGQPVIERTFYVVLI